MVMPCTPACVTAYLASLQKELQRGDAERTHRSALKTLIESAAPGLLATNEPKATRWLDNPTFRGMRAQLMADFDDIYVLDLHGNSKKKERTPQALHAQGDDKNVFDIEQGVSITFLVKLPGQTGAATTTTAPVEEVFELTAPDPNAVKKTKALANVVAALTQTRTVMAQVDAIVCGKLWPL